MTDFKTPTIPEWIKGISHPLYRNVFSFDLGNKNLWGTETLLGDWDGEYLLLAKDFYPASYISEGIRSGLANPYRHNPKAPTNRNLLKILRHFGKMDSAHDRLRCNFLYASACFLLRDDNKISGNLPDAANVLALSAPVVKWTIDHMPGIRSVIAMGKDAQFANRTAGISEMINAKGLNYFEVSHPASRISDQARLAEWEPVFRQH